MNIKEKRVELRSSKFTTSNDSLQMGADFVSAFAMGFDIDDAIALLRLDSLYIQSFDIKDVRQTLGQDALGRAIGRIAGKDGVCRSLASAHPFAWRRRALLLWIRDVLTV
jgi:RNA-binding protein PNO1